MNFKEPCSDFISVLRASRKLDLDYAHDAKGIASDADGVTALPNLFVLDRDDRVALVHRGYSEATLQGFMEELLSLLPEEVRRRTAAASPTRTGLGCGHVCSSNFFTPPRADLHSL